eukprot:CAMPEP_0119141516 /NCGR_PEP_ID=MMETSP1310-20130426/31152_1 /TAXON_ID=464262 /ORGANISM="Genus nov. species nov., Strain RCC2339" /LENGTH=69 /DNA_ID=CAMNT_0007132967 /DNA_START=109 /DNA_END=318 /DNA_ORIENTATION=+
MAFSSNFINEFLRCLSTSAPSACPASSLRNATSSNPSSSKSSSLNTVPDAIVTPPNSPPAPTPRTSSLD